MLRRTIVNDVTVEKQVEILANNPHLLCANDEIASWIGGWDAYKSGKGVKDVSFYLSSYEGDSHSIERKTSGSAFAEKCAVSVIGGVQPAKAKTLFKGLTDNGLAQRIMPIYVKSLGDGQDVNPDPDIATTLERIAADLASCEGRVHRFSPEAAAELKYVQEFAKREIESGRYSTAFVEWLNKTATIFGRLALISHYIESAYDFAAEPPELISLETARRARRYVCEFLFGHAEAFYAEVIGTTNADEHAEWIAGFILSKELTLIRERDIYQKLPALKGDRRGGIPDAMRALELYRLGDTDEGTTSKAFRLRWTVDERVHDGRFQEWADEERTDGRAARKT